MDNKHIDADRLKAEIIRLRKERPFHDDASFLAYLHGLSKIEDFIDPHQQEQPCDIAIDLDAIFSNMKRNEAIKQLEYLNKVYGKQPCDTCTNDKGCVTCKDGDINSIKGWVARDKANDLYFFTYKPHRTDGVFHSEISEDILHLSNDMFPELSWETEPIEVELLPKKLM